MIIEGKGDDVVDDEEEKVEENESKKKKLLRRRGLQQRKLPRQPPLHSKPPNQDKKRGNLFFKMKMKKMKKLLYHLRSPHLHLNRNCNKLEKVVEWDHSNSSNMLQESWKRNN